MIKNHRIEKNHISLTVVHNTMIFLSLQETDKNNNPQIINCRPLLEVILK